MAQCRVTAENSILGETQLGLGLLVLLYDSGSTLDFVFPPDP